MKDIQLFHNLWITKPDAKQKGQYWWLQMTILISLQRLCGHIWVNKRMRMRVLYKLLVLTYRALEGKGPSYLQDIIELYKLETSVVLRSDGRLDLPWSKIVSYGNRAFSVAAPAEWNNLPSDLKDCTYYNLFKSKLKTNLFERYYC